MRIRGAAAAENAIHSGLQSSPGSSDRGVGASEISQDIELTTKYCNAVCAGGNPLGALEDRKNHGARRQRGEWSHHLDTSRIWTGLDALERLASSLQCRRVGVEWCVCVC